MNKEMNFTCHIQFSKDPLTSQFEKEIETILKNDGPIAALSYSRNLIANKSTNSDQAESAIAASLSFLPVYAGLNTRIAESLFSMAISACNNKQNLIETCINKVIPLLPALANTSATITFNIITSFFKICINHPCLENNLIRSTFDAFPDFFLKEKGESNFFYTGSIARDFLRSIAKFSGFDTSVLTGVIGTDKNESRIVIMSCAAKTNHILFALNRKGNLPQKIEFIFEKFRGTAIELQRWALNKYNGDESAQKFYLAEINRAKKLLSTPGNEYQSFGSAAFARVPPFSHRRALVVLSC